MAVYTQVARHCTAEDTETHEVFEVDTEGDRTALLVNAAAFAQSVGDREFTFEHHVSDPADRHDDFEVIVFTVAK